MQARPAANRCARLAFSISRNFKEMFEVPMGVRNADGRYSKRQQDSTGVLWGRGPAEALLQLQGMACLLSSQHELRI
jgi:hypothetical protein